MSAAPAPGLPWRHVTATWLLVSMLLAVMLMILLYAPTEASMGHVQRILYLHVSAAWCGLGGCVGMSLCGAVYLLSRRAAWDQWSQAAGEVGWLGCTLTLVTGSLWAREAWGVWWTWEPRLASSAVLWLIYAGVFLVRAGIDEPHRRARVGAVLTILGAVDIPMVVMATRWFRGVHPVAPEMDPRMRLALAVAVVGFTTLFAILACRRRQQLGFAERMAALEALFEEHEGSRAAPPSRSGSQRTYVGKDAEWRC